MREKGLFHLLNMAPGTEWVNKFHTAILAEYMLAGPNMSFGPDMPAQIAAGGAPDLYEEMNLAR